MGWYGKVFYYAVVMMWCGLVWRGMGRCSIMVSCIIVWYGMVWCVKLPFATSQVDQNDFINVFKGGLI